MLNHNHEEDFCLPCFMSLIDPLLPVQGPIKDFIAGTKVPLFIPHPYDEGLEIAAGLYHSRSYMDLCYYREKFKTGEISHTAVMASIEQNFLVTAPEQKELVRHALDSFIEIFDEKTFHKALSLNNFSQEKAKILMDGFLDGAKNEAKPTSRHVLQKIIHAPMDHHVNAILFRLLGAYVDQGVNLWPFLDRYDGFQSAVLALANKSHFPIAPFVNNYDLAKFLKLDSETTIKKILGQILLSPKNYHNFLTESVFDHPGWSGMVNMIAKFPDSLAKKRPVSMAEFMAVKLALEWQFIKRSYPQFSPIHPEEVAEGDLIQHYSAKAHAQSLTFWLLSLPKTPTQDHQEVVNKINLQILQKTWHHALENTYYHNAARIILSEHSKSESIDVPKEFQAIFCIDDRECSLRRHLEEENPNIETFGYAGFFGVDCYFKAHKKDLLDKMCPLPVTPKHVVLEKVLKKDKTNKGLLEFASFVSLHGANSTFFGFISAYTIGHLSLFRLILSFLQPFKIFKIKQLVQEEKTTLLFQRLSDSQKMGNLYIGYSETEMADRVFAVLNNMGLKQGLAPLVFVIGHGSSSVNNPHFAAYDCGACSGRPGAINARVFAAMANLPSVRHLVREKGIDIPESTRFIGGFHDTCTDAVSFFDTADLSTYHASLLAQFIKHVDRACAKNALERCQKFALIPPNITQKEALAEVNHRARALFEPRPELGHATNALTIVGRRSRSYLKNLDRRAFLQSYDPNNDESGAILGNLLAAVIPVCGGINLEYTFSKIDPAIHGCGTKLSHNVCSLIGVGNGLDDDLRTGLPIQTTELHIPIRLLIVIEQTPEIILQAINSNPNLKPWLVNGWVKIASLNKDINHLSMFDHEKGRFFELMSA